MSKRIEELEKGCGKVERYPMGNHYETCGKDKWLCKKCMSRLEERKQAEKEFLELINEEIEVLEDFDDDEEFRDCGSYEDWFLIRLNKLKQKITGEKQEGGE